MSGECRDVFSARPGRNSPKNPVWDVRVRPDHEFVTKRDVLGYPGEVLEQGVEVFEQQVLEQERRC